MKISIKILSILSAAVMMFTSMSFGVFAQSKEDLEAEFEKNEKIIEDAKKKIDAYKNDAAKKENYIDALNKQMRADDAQIEILNGEVSILDAEIAELDKQIAEFTTKITALENEIASIDAQKAEKNKEIDETYEILKKRLRAAYMAGETSELEIFLGATDFQDFLTRSELIRQVSKHDKKIVSDLEERIESLNKMVAELSEKRAELEKSKKTLDEDRAATESKKQSRQGRINEIDKRIARNEASIREVNKMLSEINENSAEYERLKNKAEAENRDIANELDNWVGDNTSNGSGDISGGDGEKPNHSFRVSKKGMICPLQDRSVQYSANYASHSARGTKAVDFVARQNRFVHGKTYVTTKTAKIYAVASGKVVRAIHSTSLSGYGNYLIIDHGNGVSSLYAHCDTLNVGVGATVKQGQIIATVGNTGNCWPRPSASNPVAGAHLHFEVRINGNRVNPEPYMPTPFI